MDLVLTFAFKFLSLKDSCCGLACSKRVAELFTDELKSACIPSLKRIDTRGLRLTEISMIALLKHAVAAQTKSLIFKLGGTRFSHSQMSFSAPCWNLISECKLLEVLIVDDRPHDGPQHPKNLSDTAAAAAAANVWDNFFVQPHDSLFETIPLIQARLRLLATNCQQISKLQISSPVLTAEALTEINSLPLLKELSFELSSSFNPTDEQLNDLICALPNLQQLNLMLTQFSATGRTVRRTDRQHQHLKVVIHRYCEESSIFRTKRLRCGICNDIVVPRIDGYMICAPTQGHISHECFFHVSPEPDAIAPFEPGSADMWNCARNCHAVRGLFLLAAPASFIDTRGYAFAAACGEGLAILEDATLQHDPQATVTHTPAPTSLTPKARSTRTSPPR
jgi:hypothetical protein